MCERDDFDKPLDIEAIRQMVEFGSGIGDVSRIPKIERAIYVMRVDPHGEMDMHGQNTELGVKVGPITDESRTENISGCKQSDKPTKPRLIDTF
jgi:hypothetical protein